MDVFEFIRSLGADVKLTATIVFGVFGFVFICWETGKRKLRGFLMSFILVALATGGLNKIGMFSDMSEETFDKYDRGATSFAPSSPASAPPVVDATQAGQVGQVGNRATVCCVIGFGVDRVDRVDLVDLVDRVGQVA